MFRRVQLGIGGCLNRDALDLSDQKGAMPYFLHLA